MTTVGYGCKMNSLPNKIHLVEENASAEFSLLERSKLYSCRSIDKVNISGKWFRSTLGNALTVDRLTNSDICTVEQFPRNC